MNCLIQVVYSTGLTVYSAGLTGITDYFCQQMPLNPFLNKPGFYVFAVQVFWKHCGKRENGLNKQFLLFPHRLLPVWRTLCHFHQIWICRLQIVPVWKSLKFVVWERAKLKISKKVVPYFQHGENIHCHREIFPHSHKLWHFSTHNISKDRHMKYM